MRAILNFEHQCTLKCDWCYVPFVRDRPNFSVTQEVLARLLDHGVTEITIGGGDPTTYREWRDLVASAKRAGLFVHLDTNGIGLRRSTDVEVALRSHVDLLGLPIDGPNPFIHGLVRGQPWHFNVVIERMSWLVELGLDVKINTVVTKVNAPSLLQTAELVRSLAPAIWSVYEYWPLSAGGANRNQWDDVGGSLADAIASLPRELGKTRVEINRRHVRRLTYPIVAHDGEVYIHSASNIDGFQPLGSIFDDNVLGMAFSSCAVEREEARSRYIRPRPTN